MKACHDACRWKRLFCVLLSCLLLLPCSACGQDEQETPPTEYSLLDTPVLPTPNMPESDRLAMEESPLNGASFLDVRVGDGMGGTVWINTDVLDDSIFVDPDSLEEGLSVLGDVIPETVKSVSFNCDAREALVHDVFTLLPDIPETTNVDVMFQSAEWPVWLTSENMIFRYADMSHVLTDRYPRVKRLELRDCENVTKDTIGGAFPNLQELRIMTGDLQDWDQPMPKVEKAYFCACSGLSMEMLENNFPALTELGLSVESIPADLNSICQTGIQTLIIYLYETDFYEHWYAIDHDYGSDWLDSSFFELYDLSEEVDRETVAQLLPESAWELVENCLDRGIQVYVQDDLSK